MTDNRCSRGADAGATEIVIAVAGAGDAAAMADVQGSAFAEAWPAAAMVQLLALPTSVALIARHGGEAVGFIVLQVAADEAELISVGVRPSHRRQGIARRLLDHGLAAVFALGAARMTLEVAVDNCAARRLYAGFGYRCVGKRPAYYRRGATATVDAAVYALDLGRR